jgi:signal peptidase I
MNFISSLKKNIGGFLVIIFLALIFRTLIFEPFHIPSSSMKPNLLIGDYIFVKKWSYGYDKYALPFHPSFIHGKIFSKSPKRGDVVVFVPPKDSKRYYIKRVIGISGDKISIGNGEIFVNDCKILNEDNGVFTDRIEELNRSIDFKISTEKNCDGRNYQVMNLSGKPSLYYEEEYIVPENHVFMMGDNRDNSKDSRFDEVGFIPEENIVGKACFIGISFNTKIDFGSISDLLKFVRYNRIFHSIN